MIVAARSPRVADTSLGAPGTPKGTTTPDSSDAAPEPAQFAARTVNAYGVPFVSPETEQDVGPETQVQVPPSGEDVTV